MIPGIRHEYAFAEYLLPAVLAIRVSWISRDFRTVGVVGVHLVVLRIHASATGIKDFGSIRTRYMIEATLYLKHIQVDLAGVVHDVEIMLPGKDVTGTTHISSKLIDMVERFALIGCQDLIEAVILPQVKNLEFVSHSWLVLRMLEVDTPNPKPFVFKAGHHVVSDKSASAENKCSFHKNLQNEQENIELYVQLQSKH
jgi:hypothetical protein